MCGTETGLFFSFIATGLSWCFYFVDLFAPFIIMLDRLVGVMNPFEVCHYISETKGSCGDNGNVDNWIGDSGTESYIEF